MAAATALITATMKMMGSVNNSRAGRPRARRTKARMSGVKSGSRALRSPSSVLLLRIMATSRARSRVGRDSRRVKRKSVVVADIMAAI